MSEQAKVYKVLVVDDHPVNLKVATFALKYGGYQIFEATSAERAFELVAQDPPDIILMDISLPGMDGLTFTRQLKADPALKHIKVAALTAYAMKGDDQKALDAGCDAYITKPINTRKLGEQVAEILGLVPRGTSGNTTQFVFPPPKDSGA